MSDLLGVGLTVSFVFFFLILSEGLAYFEIISKENARKLLHISVGNVIFFVPLFDTRIIATAVPAIFVVGNFMLSPLSPIQRLQLRTFKAGHEWGTILYPLSISIITYIGFYDHWLLVVTIFPLVYGDGLAAVFGPKAKQGHFTSIGGEKTLIGTSVMVLASWISVLVGLLIFGYSMPFSVAMASASSLIGSLIELLSFQGMDNLEIPLISAPMLWWLEPFLLHIAENIEMNIFLQGVILGMVFAIGGYITEVLTLDGAIAGFLITLFMVGLGGYVIGVQLLLFFIAGSIATKVVRKIARSTQDEFEKGDGKRDALQALANAGLPSVLVLFYLNSNQILWFYVISAMMTTAMVDTLATEVGIAFDGTPRSVFNPLKKAKKGATGVISLQGTIGGLIFGFIMIISVYFIQVFDPIIEFEISEIFIGVMLVAGFIGMISDSITGATLQRRNRCQMCDEIVEANIHHKQVTEHIKGLSWFNNDINNLVGVIIGSIVALLLYYFIFIL